MGDISIFRCRTCGLLLTDRMIRKGICEGHHVGYAHRGTIAEYIAIKFRVKILEPLEVWWESRKK
jgi:hypothetical protein